MKNRKTWRVFIVSLVLFTFLSYYLPLYQEGTELVSLALSVTSVLFGLLIGFFITQMWNKFSTVRRESAVMRASILGMITNMRRLQGNEELINEFEDLMEKFLIAFTMISWDSVEEEDKYFSAVGEKIDDVKLINERDKVIYRNILDAESKAGQARSKLASVGKQNLMKLEWMVLLTLSTVMTASVLLLRDGSLFFTALSSVMPPLVILTMMILDDLDNLRWGTRIVSFEPAQAALETLHRKKFYEKRFIDGGWVEEPESYRTEEDLEGELRAVYDELKLKDCLREEGLLGPKL